MLQTYKIFHGFDDVSSDTWFTVVGAGDHRLTRLTADPIHLLPSRSRLEIRSNFFSQSVVNMWNSLPGDFKTLEIRRFSKRITNVLQETLFETIIDKKKKMLFTVTL